MSYYEIFKCRCGYWYGVDEGSYYASPLDIPPKKISADMNLYACPCCGLVYFNEEIY